MLALRTANRYSQGVGGTNLAAS
jgi:adenylosuccinate synthase